MAQAAAPVKVTHILAGKWRRYHGIPFVEQFFYWPTLSGNIKDFFTFGIGLIQSIWLLLFNRPDVVFTKGGFVCVPVGLAAALLRIPLVIHDSDASPGLTNRILSRYARFIATGAPLEYYPYPKDRSFYVGIPISNIFVPTSENERANLKTKLGFQDRPLIFVTGGGTGAQPINDVLNLIANNLTKKAQIVHLTGVGKAEAVKARISSPYYYVYEFVDQNQMAQLICAADVVISRAGASTLLELAAAAKATIIIPNPRLTSGHQLKNAAIYEKTGAALILHDEDIQTHPKHLQEAIVLLLTDKKKRLELEKNMHKFAKPKAAYDVAELIIKAHRQ